MLALFCMEIKRRKAQEKQGLFTICINGRHSTVSREDRLSKPITPLPGHSTGHIRRQNKYPDRAMLGGAFIEAEAHQ